MNNLEPWDETSYFPEQPSWAKTSLLIVPLILTQIIFSLWGNGIITYSWLCHALQSVLGVVHEMWLQILG